MGQGTWGMYDDVEDEIRRMDMEDRRKRLSASPSDTKLMRQKYDVASKASVGSTIECPCCGRKHTKTTYSKVFCSNYKTAGNNNCKDKFWNTVDSSRMRYLSSR